MKKRKWLFGLGAFVLAFAMVVTAMPYTIPQITAEAATSYSNHDVVEGQELFNIDNTFDSISHSGTSTANISHDGGWSIRYQAGATQNWWIDSYYVNLE